MSRSQDRSPWSPRVLAALAVTAAVAGNLRAPPRILHPVDVYDRDSAIVLAGRQVPDSVDSFYFFVLDSDTTVDQDGDEMAQILRRAAAEEDYLGIVGPDPERNRATLIHALGVARGESLRGVIVIYVGPSHQAEDLAARVGAAGAELRFVVYPEDGGSSI